MPEICRFWGIVIRIYARGEHGFPHFHAYYGEYSAVFKIFDGKLLEGGLPKAQTRLVQAWAEIHKKALEENWDLISAGKDFKKIESQ